ncbi:hypothetical protein ABZW10_17165 [Kitasatospora sp. NPDC004723]|uniref:hypothetical protein n=1 Tax=Kitasatospora sp. NPDC004723 TaxID=3154288 RepID=UPI0033ADADFD
MSSTGLRSASVDTAQPHQPFCTSAAVSECTATGGFGDSDGSSAGGCAEEAEES